ncbi:hypothetical protein BP6252_13645 [Coleophoma cylindrospora]|uniref:DUF7908 domain-containing protein n=1 Tax=Coleophoma cylindrospora TaxID=1849047 RepID=A0A3D8Q9V1_9HELO|nr:hypothetical protein BP6252_13645 [Coleophoma cylindrospora]
MRCSSTFLGLIFGLLHAVSASVQGEDLVARQKDSCHSNLPATTLHLASTVLVYPIHIDTFISADTVININGGVTININNAPTYLQTNILATITSVETTTSTRTQTVTVPTTTSLGAGSFQLAIGSVPLARRQKAPINFVNLGGSLDVSCETAAAFNIINGLLFDDANRTISAHAGVGSLLLVGNSKLSNISTVFSIGNGVLAWTNDAFVGGAARFCQSSDGIYAVFDGKLPLSCGLIQLLAEPLANCPGFRISSAFTTTSNTANTTSELSQSLSTTNSLAVPSSMPSGSSASSDTVSFPTTILSSFAMSGSLETTNSSTTTMYSSSPSIMGSTSASETTSQSYTTTTNTPCTTSPICASTLLSFVDQLSHFSGAVLQEVIGSVTPLLGPYDPTSCYPPVVTDKSFGAPQPTGKGQDVVQCIHSTLDSVCLTALPDACNSLTSVNGLDLHNTLHLCTTALGPFSFDKNTSSCFPSYYAVNSTTQGAPIVDCLSNVFGIECQFLNT